MSLSKSIKYVFVANTVNLIINLLTNFLLPKYLAVDAYANIKTFQFYVGYVGILHLGYADGMFLKYGGVNIEDISHSELTEDIYTMRLFQLVVAVICITGCFISRRYLLLTFSLAILPLNMKNYFVSMFQASGEFRSYARLMNVFNIITFAGNIILLVIGQGDNYLYFIMLYLLGYVFVWLYVELLVYKKYGIKSVVGWNVDFSILYSNIKSGSLLMLGNLTSVIFTGVDRWCIKFFMDNYAFAQYSFAVSVEGLINFLVLPLSSTFYNYLCVNRENEKKINELINMISIIACFVVMVIFPVQFFVLIFLKNYVDALNTLKILFSAQIMYFVIKCVFNNLYKAFKKQKKYFIRLLTVIMCAIFLNIILFHFMNTMDAFAIGTLISALIWFLLSVKDFKRYINFKSILYIFMNMSVILFTNTSNVLIDCAIYILFYVLITYIIMRNYLKSFIVLLGARKESKI